jgi:hypothetical protein
MKEQVRRIAGWAILAAGLAVSGSVGWTRAPEDRFNMGCVTRLRLPVYPPIAYQARITANLTAAIVVAKDGAVQSVTFEDVSARLPAYAKFFFSQIEDTVRASQFAANCAGKTVRISYVFGMDGEPPAAATWFGFPNRVEIWQVTPPL